MVKILIGSCDKYDFLWDDFTKYFGKHFDQDIIESKPCLISEIKTYNNKDFDTVCTGYGQWTDRMQRVLSQISDRYVFWLQDDYFFIRDFKKEQFDYGLQIMEMCAEKFMFAECSSLYSLNHIQRNLYKFQKNSYYTVSMQMGFWRTDLFLDLVTKLPNIGINDFEIDGSKLLNQRFHDCYILPQQEPFYLEAMRQGKETDFYRELKSQK